MKRPTFLQGALVALLLSMAGGVSFTALAPAFGSAGVLRALIALLGLAYVLYLMSRSPAHVGRIVTVALWLAGATLAWVLTPPAALYALIHVTMLWLIRSLYFYAGVLPALIDLGLCALAVVVAVATIGHTGSLFLALWCFFLVQALHGAIPESLRARGQRGSEPVEDPFDRARRVAEAALKRIYAGSP